MLSELHAFKVLFNAESVGVVSGHFRSRDKDGGHIIRSAIAEPSPPAIRKPHDFIYYWTGVIAD